MGKIKQAIENNLGWSLIVSSFAGLMFPYGALIPDQVIVALLSTLIFLSCFRINVPLRDVISWKPLVFCILRYAVAPVLLWAVCREIAPGFAIGVLLLALVPAGTSSAVLTGIYNGNVGLAFLVTIMGSIMSVFLIPFEIGSLNHLTVGVPVFAILKTLVLCILLPGGIYLGLRNRAFLNNYSRFHGRLTSIVLLSLLSFVGLSKKRDYFLIHPQDMIVPFLIVMVFFALAIILGFATKTRQQDRIAYGVCSSFNNTSLGVGLSILYFDEKTIFIMIAALFMWSFLPIFVEPVIKRCGP